MVDTFFVRAGIFRDWIARTSLFHTHRHVVLVGTVAAVVDPVAQLISGDTLMIGTLKPSVCITLEVCYVKTQQYYVTLIVKQSSNINQKQSHNISGEKFAQNFLYNFSEFFIISV